MNVTDLLPIVPIVAGVVEVAKRTGLPSRLAGAAALVVGVAAALLVGPDGADAGDVVLGGITAGLIRPAVRHRLHLPPQRRRR